MWGAKYSDSQTSLMCVTLSIKHLFVLYWTQELKGSEVVKLAQTQLWHIFLLFRKKIIDTFFWGQQMKLSLSNRIIRGKRHWIFQYYIMQNGFKKLMAHYNKHDGLVL